MARRRDARAYIPYHKEGVFHSNGGVDEQDTDTDGWCDFVEDDPSEKEQLLNTAVEEATTKGISDACRDELNKLLREYPDVLRIRLGKRAPADVEPMVIDLDEKARPVRAPAKREFLEDTTTKLIEAGFLRQLPDSQWVAAPLIVPKAPPAYFRLTIDLRPVNTATKPMTWPMPNIESEIGDLRDSRFFASIDFVSRYWQLQLAEQSQPLHAFMTTKATVMPTRTLQGSSNSGSNFQSRAELRFRHMRHALKAWLDDFSIDSGTESEFLKELRHFLQTCRK